MKRTFELPLRLAIVMMVLAHHSEWGDAFSAVNYRHALMSGGATCTTTGNNKGTRLMMLLRSKPPSMISISRTTKTKPVNNPNVCTSLSPPPRQKGTLLTSTVPSEEGESQSDPNDDDTDNTDTGGDEKKEESTTKLARFKKRTSSYFKGNEKDDGLTFRQRLAKMGLATVLSYGWISNTNAMILVASAWYVFSLKTKMSPLYPGQWKNFLGVYAGFYVVSNFLRPFRVTLAVAIGPYFDRLVNWIQRKTKLPKAVAITATVLLVNLGGTIVLMIGGLSLASLLSGVPIFPPKV